jgi:uncharacterized membrane protein YfcA
MEVPSKIIIWIIAVMVGGLLGSWTGGFKLSASQLKYLITTVLIIASIKLFII